MPWAPEPSTPDPFEDGDWSSVDPPVPTVDDSPRYATGVIYGPDGEPLVWMVDRPPVTGFAAWLYRDGYWPECAVEE